MRRFDFRPVVVFAALCCSCAQNHEGHSHDHDAEEMHDGHHDHDGHDHDGDHDEHDGHGAESHEHTDGIIELSPERAAKLGIKVDTLRLQSVSDVVSVTGEVITDPADQGVIVAPVSGRLTFTSDIKIGNNVTKGRSIASVSGAGMIGGDANKAAKIEMEAAKKELDRLAPLREEGLATAAEYNAALRAYETARNAMGSGSSAAVSPLSGVITAINAVNGQYVEAGQPIATVSANKNVRVRADVPRRLAPAAASVRSALIRVPYSDLTFDATVAAPPAEAMATPAYQPVYFNVPASDALSPGSYVEVFLRVGDSHPGILVPQSCVTDRLGQKFVYVRLDEDCYERRPVTIGSVDGPDVEVTSGLASGDVVVTGGTTFVRLAESSNVAVPGHTHNH